MVTLEYLDSVIDGVETWIDVPASIVSSESNVLFRVKEERKTYEWELDGTPILGGSFRYFQAIYNGAYDVNTVSSSGEEDTSAAVSVMVSGVPSCFIRMLRPVQDAKNALTNTEIIFDVRFNYTIPAIDTINVAITDGGTPVLKFVGQPSGSNVHIYDSLSEDGTDSGYRYQIHGLRFRGGSTIRIDLVVGV